MRCYPKAWECKAGCAGILAGNGSEIQGDTGDKIVKCRGNTGDKIVKYRG